VEQHSINLDKYMEFKFKNRKKQVDKLIQLWYFYFSVILIPGGDKMSKDKSSIHDFDVNIIVEYYSTLERQGPGSPEVTKKALSFIEGLNENSKIADIGCGSGGQTMIMAQTVPGTITGIDLFPLFVNKFNENAKKLGLLMYSEGAIYNIGFEKGLKEWRKFLKKGGYVAVSEVSWFTNERPKEIEDFWMDAYPEIDTIPNKLKQMQDAGYVPVASFILPEICWTEHFYAPQVQAQINFLKKNEGNEAAEGFVENQRHETRLYHKYKDCYGYVFYIGKKI